MEIILLIAASALLIFLAYKSKRITAATVVFVSGALKTGKTQLTLWQAYKDYQTRYRKWWFTYIFGKGCRLDKPIFYSNVQLNLPQHIKVCWLSENHILRKTRLQQNCTCFIDEAALVARSSDWTDKDVSDVLTDFIKLYAHETWGGAIYIDTQAISDLHHSFKRCISTYYYIHHQNKFVPWYSVMHIKEMMADPSNADQSLDRVSSGGNEDVTTTLRWCLCPKKVWKWYDRFTYSVLTDHLPLEADPQPRTKNLKTSLILRLKLGGKKNEKRT